MGNRLTKIYTKTGDDGTTGLGDGARVAKDDIRVEAYGTVDEVNSAIGLIASTLKDKTLSATLHTIQHTLLNLGGELCIPGHLLIKQTDIEHLEVALDALNKSLPPLKEFILPGGSQVAAYAHLARTICRRAERRLVTLQKATDNINPLAIQYLNRLSDYLFVFARYVDKEAGGEEVLWER